MVRLGSSLLLAKLGIIGGLASLISPFLRGFMGLLIEDGTFLIDISLDAYREGQKLKEFEEEARKAYEHAASKVHSPEEKEKIRAQYLAIIARIGAVGSVPR